MRPILSICIPTYNRATILEETLKRIVSYHSFDARVELVISDNCSTDNTQQVCEAFAAEHPNIRYYRNQENINDRNFIMALNRGNGEYLKLMNDWFYPTEAGLSFMTDSLQANLQQKTPLFFTSDGIRAKGSEIIMCRNLDDYIKAVSVMATSNNLFGAWKSDWEALEDKDRFAALKLQQVDWSYNIVSSRGCILYNQKIFEHSHDVLKSIRRGFNFFEVMLNNYYSIMHCYLNQGKLSKETMDADKKYFLRHFRPALFQALVCHTSKYWQYDTTGTFKILYSHYKDKPYFYFFIAFLPFQWFFHASIRDFWK